jgi:hypothetical protein
MRLKLPQPITTPRLKLARLQFVRFQVRVVKLRAAISTAPYQGMTEIHPTLPSPRTRRPRPTAIVLHRLIGTVIARLASSNTHKLAPLALDETLQLSFYDDTGVHGVDCMHHISWPERKAFKEWRFYSIPLAGVYVMTSRLASPSSRIGLA